MQVWGSTFCQINFVVVHAPILLSVNGHSLCAATGIICLLLGPAGTPQVCYLASYATIIKSSWNDPNRADDKVQTSGDPSRQKASCDWSVGSVLIDSFTDTRLAYNAYWCVCTAQVQWMDRLCALLETRVRIGEDLRKCCNVLPEKIANLCMLTILNEYAGNVDCFIYNYTRGNDHGIIYVL